jgi:prophage regulatory protein
MAQTILRMPGVRAATGLSKSGIYNLIRAGDFPKPVSLGARARGWKEADIDRWIESRRTAGAA